MTVIDRMSNTFLTLTLILSLCYASFSSALAESPVFECNLNPTPNRTVPSARTDGVVSENANVVTGAMAVMVHFASGSGLG